jgi:hypothetical protein
VALLVVAISVFAATTAGAARKSPFESGVYVGKTSQGYPVKLQWGRRRSVYWRASPIIPATSFFAVRIASRV